MEIKIISTSGDEIVTLTEAKLWLSLDDDITTKDDLINSLITSARQYFENKTNRSLMVHVAQRKFIEKSGRISLFYDSSSIESVNAYTNGDASLIPDTNYFFDEFSSELVIKGTLEDADYYIVEFTTKQLKDDVVKMALKRIIKDAYDSSGDPAKAIRTATDRIISSYKRWRFQ